MNNDKSLNDEIMAILVAISSYLEDQEMSYSSNEIKPRISPSKSTRDSISSFNKIISKKPASNTDLLNEEGVVNSPLPGTASLKCKVGDKVKKGDLLVILESMKMENPIIAPKSGTIKDIAISNGSSVKSGDLILILS